MAMNEMMDFKYITLGTLIEAYVLSVLYGKWAAGNYEKNSGFRFGAWVGIFVGFGIGLLMYGTFQLLSLGFSSGQLLECPILWDYWTNHWPGIQKLVPLKKQRLNGLIANTLRVVGDNTINT